MGWGVGIATLASGHDTRPVSGREQQNGGAGPQGDGQCDLCLLSSGELAAPAVHRYVEALQPRQRPPLVPYQVGGLSEAEHVGRGEVPVEGLVLRQDRDPLRPSTVPPLPAVLPFTTACPLTSSAPEVAASMPLMMLISVDLRAPLAPTSAMMRLAGSWKLHARSAHTLP
jgi:hypothetical protein